MFILFICKKVLKWKKSFNGFLWLVQYQWIHLKIKKFHQKLSHPLCVRSHVQESGEMVKPTLPHVDWSYGEAKYGWVRERRRSHFETIHLENDFITWKKKLRGARRISVAQCAPQIVFYFIKQSRWKMFSKYLEVILTFRVILRCHVGRASHWTSVQFLFNCIRIS